MHSSQVKCGGGRLSRMMHEEEAAHCCASGHNASATDALSFELKGEKADCFQASSSSSSSVSVSSLKVRLAPAIQSALAAAVDALLREVALVLSDALTEAQRELASRERENERLKLRLEESEGELRALQECVVVSGARRLAEQPPPPANAAPAAFGQPQPASASSSSSSFPNLPPHPAGLPECGGERNPAAQFFITQTRPDGQQESGAAEPSNALLLGFDEIKVDRLSMIQADAAAAAANRLGSPGPPWDAVAGAGECSAEIKTCSPEAGAVEQRIQPKFPIKQEPDLGLGQHGRMAAVEGLPAASENEQTAQSVGELGRIHVVEEEGPSRSLDCPFQIGIPRQPLLRSHGSAVPDGLRTLAKSHPGAGVYQGAAVGSNGPPFANATSESSERPHLCLECGKTFRLISSLRKHIRIHTGEKPYPCGVCGRHFRESGALKTHQRIHTGEKPYYCSDCGTSFRHLDGLRKHRRTHTGEKPYACVLCGKRLSRLQHLKHHQRIHTGERPCRCPRCHKCFKEPAALRKHLRTHREEAAGEDPAEACGERSGPGPAMAEDFGRLQAPMLSTQMGFGMWGEDGEEGAAVNCIEER
ncbi:zinc finger protein 628 isoform X2 [Scleropages formosus]|uniref:zinc finger protein 628 isoform X2 n=1 Tax=Scleropages formosus TaxID=113540 RepID=UPI0010FA7961|nr:zinc finger protein 628-like isoform X2 [Scleropages formosus]